MRRLPLALVSVFLLSFAPPGATAQEAARATLVLEVRSDGAEDLLLTFGGLRPLTQYNGICMPTGARVARVHDDVGDAPYESRMEDGREVLSFVARRDSLRVVMERPGTASLDAPFVSRDVNFCVPSGSGVRVDVLVPRDHRLFFLSPNGTIDAPTAGRAQSEGPSHVFYSYETPLPPEGGLEAFDEGPFRVVAPAALAAPAREVARLAAGPFDAALVEAGLGRPFDTIRIRVSSQTPHDWEAGHYNGRGYVTVKESAFDADPTTGFPYTAVKLLVHESFHAASFPYGEGEVDQTIAWWLEGTARRAERHVDRALPNASTYCEKSAAEVKCWSFDDRIERRHLDSGYEPGFEFERDWEPSLPQSEDTRRFYYGFSEFLVGAWIAQNGEPSYRAVWDSVEAALRTGRGCPCGEGWLEGLLRDPDVFRPWADLRTTDPAGFEARVTPFVKDEAALQRELDARSGPLGGLGVPFPAWAALAGVAAAAAYWQRRRSA